MDPLIQFNIVPEKLLRDIYGDVFSPGAKEFGVCLGQLVSSLKLFTFPLAALGSTSDMLLKRYNAFLLDSFNKVPKEKLVAPKPNIYAPILQNVIYVFDQEELKNLYSNLLASASNSEKHNSAHPAFTEVIKGLDVIDAVLLKQLKKEHVIPYIETKFELTDTREFLYPLVEPFTLVSGYEDNYNQVAFSLQNLERLNLIIKSPHFAFVHQDEIYNKIFASPVFNNYKENDKYMKEHNFSLRGTTIQKNCGNFLPTLLGQLFIDTCL